MHVINELRLTYVLGSVGPGRRGGLAPPVSLRLATLGAYMRYGLEHLLYRLSVSPHASRFSLKGALLFSLWYEQPHRPTCDAVPPGPQAVRYPVRPDGLPAPELFQRETRIHVPLDRRPSASLGSQNIQSRPRSGFLSSASSASARWWA